MGNSIPMNDYYHEWLSECKDSTFTCIYLWCIITVYNKIVVPYNNNTDTWKAWLEDAIIITVKILMIACESTDSE